MKDKNIYLSVGDFIVERIYDDYSVEVVTHVGMEGYLLFSLTNRMVGSMERYIKQSTVGYNFVRKEEMTEEKLKNLIEASL